MAVRFIEVDTTTTPPQPCTNQCGEVGRFAVDFPGAVTVLCTRCYEIAVEPD